MFVQPCFIRKNTLSLRKKLEELGLGLINPSDTTLDCHNYDGKGSHKSIEKGRTIITYQSNHYGIIYNIDDVTKKGRIDCGTNEELFLALAALRDDTDSDQWFVHNNNSNLFYFCDKNEFHLFRINPENILDFYDDKVNWHKATVKELIEHFKNK